MEESNRFDFSFNACKHTASPIGATVYVRVHFVYQKSLHTYFLFYTTILDSGLRFALGSTGEAKTGHYIMFAKYIILHTCGQQLILLEWIQILANSMLQV